jgi:hypothetical protein
MPETREVTLWNDDYPHAVVQSLNTFEEIGAVCYVKRAGGFTGIGQISRIGYANEEYNMSVSFQLKDSEGDTVSNFSINAEDVYAIYLKADGTCGFRVEIWIE